jgi:hypothetical protein
MPEVLSEQVVYTCLATDFSAKIMYMYNKETGQVATVRFILLTLLLPASSPSPLTWAGVGMVLLSISPSTVEPSERSRLAKASLKNPGCLKTLYKGKKGHSGEKLERVPSRGSSVYLVTWRCPLVAFAAVCIACRLALVSVLSCPSSHASNSIAMAFAQFILNYFSLCFQLLFFALNKL